MGAGGGARPAAVVVKEVFLEEGVPGTGARQVTDPSPEPGKRGT